MQEGTPLKNVVFTMVDHGFKNNTVAGAIPGRNCIRSHRPLNRNCHQFKGKGFLLRQCGIGYHRAVGHFQYVGHVCCGRDVMNSNSALIFYHVYHFRNQRSCLPGHGRTGLQNEFDTVFFAEGWSTLMRCSTSYPALTCSPPKLTTSFVVTTSELLLNGQWFGRWRKNRIRKVVNVQTVESFQCIACASQVCTR